MFKFIVASLLLNLLAGLPTNAGALIEIKSSSERQNLIELYSSEGCSSCPPAEKWLSSLRSTPGLWQKFVPVEFHVDYWDHLGWKDPFAKSAFTQRQKDYSFLWNNQNIYTPEIVLNGEEWRDWRSSSKHFKEIGNVVGVLSAAETSAGHFRIAFTPASNELKPEFTIQVAIEGNQLESQIAAGENSGAKLKHDFVVLVLKEYQLKKSGKEFSLNIDLSSDISEANKRAKKLSLAIWVTGSAPTPLQAIGADLNR